MAQSKIRASKQIFFDADVDVNSKKLTSVAEPTADQDAATKNYVDSKVRGLDWSDSVLDQDLTAPPGGETEGDRYIVGGTGTGDWAGHDNEIAIYNGSGYDFEPLNEGVAVWVEDENIQVVWNGTTWALMGAAVSQHGLVSATHSVSGLTTGHFLKALSATTFGFEAHGLSYGDVGAEAAFSKNTAFNKDFGSGAGDVSEGNHNHSGVYEPIDSTLVRDDDAGYNNSDWDTAFGWGNHASTYELLDATIIKEADVDDTPVDGVTTAPISSNWAYDHANVHAPSNADNTAANETSHSDVLVDGDIGVNVQAYDATILVDADIGVNVQAYDATILKEADFVKREIPAGTKNGSNQDFVLATTPTSGTECVYVNGLLMNAGAGNDYTIAADTITFAVAPISTDTLLANYNK